MPNLLVTGGAGFIGANFVQYWLKHYPGARLVIMDAFTYAGNSSNLDPVRLRPELRIIEANICNTEAVECILRDEKIDTVVHFAAESHVDRSIRGPDAFVETNIVGTHSLLKAAHRVWLVEGSVNRHRFHHVSTDEVFGSLGGNDPKFKESTPYAPNSPYSASKAASDHLVRAYHKTFNLQTTISNCSNNYGPYQYPEKLIPLSITCMLQGAPIRIYGDGRNIRDWIHVTDHCAAIDLILSRGVVGETYNVGSNSEYENIELIRTLCDIAFEQFASSSHLRGKYPRCPASRGVDPGSLRTFVADRPGHDRRYAMDCEKIALELGFRPRISVTEGLRSTFLWYVEHQDWLGRIGRSTPAAQPAFDQEIVPAAFESNGARFGLEDSAFETSPNG